MSKLKCFAVLMLMASMSLRVAVLSQGPAAALSEHTAGTVLTAAHHVLHICHQAEQVSIKAPSGMQGPSLRSGCHESPRIL